MTAPNFYSEADQVVFEFFYWFTRFEYALKQNRFARPRSDGSAEADWALFVDAHRQAYAPSAGALQLMDAPPLFQIVSGDRCMRWAPVPLADCRSPLERVVRLLQTMRNNLFHGSKDGPEGWSEPAQMLALLLVGLGVLDELARLADITVEYEGM